MFEVIVDGGESAKNLNRPGLHRLLALMDSGRVEAVIVVWCLRIPMELRLSRIPYRRMYQPSLNG